MYRNFSHFGEKTTVTPLILYDVNGNMIQDKNKGITVVYNYLNLPIQVNFGPNNRIDWTYTATGTKLQKKVYTNGNLTLTQDYVSGFVYKNGTLDFFSTEAGRVKNQSGTLKYQYTLTDHLGNTRVMFEETSGTPTAIEESHYYAFGMRIEGLSTSSPDNKFTYNGKELEDDHGLNWYHYGARFYDAQIGRWHAVDPVDESHSPYVYVTNNPANAIDPSGSFRIFNNGQEVKENKQPENLKPYMTEEAWQKYWNDFGGDKKPDLYFEWTDRGITAQTDFRFKGFELRYSQVTTAFRQRVVFATAHSSDVDFIVEYGKLAGAKSLDHEYVHIDKQFRPLLNNSQPIIAMGSIYDTDRRFGIAGQYNLGYPLDQRQFFLDNRNAARSVFKRNGAYLWHRDSLSPLQRDHPIIQNHFYKK